MAINLLLWRENQAKRQTRQYGLWLLMSLIIILILALATHSFLNYLVNIYQLRNAHLSQEITAISVPNDLNKLTVDYQATSQQIKLIQAIHSNQTYFWKEWRFLQQRLPENIELTRLSWVGPELHIEGRTEFSEWIGSVIKSLENSQLFSQVILEKLDKDNETPTIRFTIQAIRAQGSS